MELRVGFVRCWSLKPVVFVSLELYRLLSETDSFYCVFRRMLYGFPYLLEMWLVWRGRLLRESEYDEKAPSERGAAFMSCGVVIAQACDGYCK